MRGRGGKRGTKREETRQICLPVCIWEKKTYLEHKTNDWMQSKISFLLGPEESLLVTVKGQKHHESGTSHTTTASPKPSFTAPWGWATQWSAEKLLDGQRQGVDIPVRARTAHKYLLQERLKRISAESPLVPHRPSRRPILLRD